MNVFLKNTLCPILAGLFITACASAGNKSSDFQDGMKGSGKRQVHFTCRLETGEVVETTRRDVAEDPEVEKAEVFAMRSSYGPVPLSLEDENLDAVQRVKELRHFGEVLMEEILEATKNWKPGEERTVHVTTQDQLEVPENERSMWLSRVKRVPKEKHYDKERFTEITTAQPEVGAIFHPYSEVKGTVASVNDNVVVVTFAPVSGVFYEGTFGTSQIVDQGGHLEIVTDIQKGRLVRVGPILGRIAEVEPERFRVDYSHAFGGESLMCDVRVEEAPLKNVSREITTDAETVSDEAFEPALARVEESSDDVSETLKARLNKEINKQMETTVSSVSKSGLGETKPALGGVDGSEEEGGIAPEEEDPHVVQQGDSALVDYAIYLKTGELISTTWPSLAESPDASKVDWYKPPREYQPISVPVGGKEASFAGLSQTILGMRVGETKNNVVLSPEFAFGKPDMRRMKEFNRIRYIPKSMTVSVQDYKDQFDAPPKEGFAFKYTPYFNAKIVEVDPQNVTLEIFTKIEEDEAPIGTTEIKELGDKFEVVLTPKIGASFEVGKHVGKIVSSGPKKFTVDFNHPLAGNEIMLDVEVLSITKSSELKDLQISWVEDHDSGLKMAKKEDKPVVMVLYADWCKWCKRLLEETFTDIEVKRFKKEFVWLKLNSDEDQSLKATYDQKGFPMTVILSPEGEVVQRLSGFQTAQGLAGELDGVLQAFGASSSAKVDLGGSGRGDQQI